MLTGLYTAASGMLARQKAQETIAVNLSHTASPGYKRQVAFIRPFAAAARTATARRPGGARLRAARLVTETRTDRSQGALRQTGNPTDLAIEGRGFFVVRTATGLALTRAGQLHVNGRGELSTGAGNALLDESGQPIYPAAPDWQVDSGGGVRVGGQKIARLQIALPKGRARSTGGRPMLISDLRPAPKGAFQIHQGFLENSNAEPIREMVAMISGARAYELSQRIIATQDQSLDRLISEVGRV